MKRRREGERDKERQTDRGGEREREQEKGGRFEADFRAVTRFILATLLRVGLFAIGREIVRLCLLTQCVSLAADLGAYLDASFEKTRRKFRGGSLFIRYSDAFVTNSHFIKLEIHLNIDEAGLICISREANSTSRPTRLLSAFAVLGTVLSLDISPITTASSPNN